MAMPSSGCLHLCDPALTGVCRSIAHAVYGASPPASVSLYNAGIAANKVDPIQMRDFYGYEALSVTLVPTGVLVSASEEFGSFNIVTSSSNNWNAYSFDMWISTSSSGTGNGTVYYSVDANKDGLPREGYIFVDSSAPTATFTINQSDKF